MSAAIAGSGGVEAATRRAVERMGLPEGSPAAAMGESAVALALVTESAARKGSASAAAMSARELRETLNALAEAAKPVDVAEDPFDRLAREMREAVETSGDGR